MTEAELILLVKPIQEYLLNNHNPYTKLEIDLDSIKLVEIKKNIPNKIN